MSLKMLEALMFAALGYVMGSVMNGYLLPKYLKGIDITKVLVEAGARIIGGCCGTTPEYIRKVAETCL